MASIFPSIGRTFRSFVPRKLTKSYQWAWPQRMQNYGNYEMPWNVQIIFWVQNLESMRHFFLFSEQMMSCTASDGNTRPSFTFQMKQKKSICYAKFSESSHVPFFAPPLGDSVRSAVVERSWNHTSILNTYSRQRAGKFTAETALIAFFGRLLRTQPGGGRFRRIPPKTEGLGGVWGRPLTTSSGMIGKPSQVSQRKSPFLCSQRVSAHDVTYTQGAPKGVSGAQKLAVEKFGRGIWEK